MSTTSSGAPGAKGRLSGRGAWLWIGGTLALLALAAVLFGDTFSGAGRAAAELQSRLNREVGLRLQDIGEARDEAAFWALLGIGLLYGIVHTLGPGHGKAIVVAYFLDASRPRAWIEGVAVGGWIAFTHTLTALLLAGGLALMGSVGPMAAQSRVRWFELLSYSLIFLIGLWRLHAGLTGRLHEHGHGDHGHAGHGHAHHEHAHPGHGQGGRMHHDHAHHGHAHGPGGAARPAAGWRRFFGRRDELGLLTAAGIAPCAGAVVMVLLAYAFGVLWAGLAGVLAIALGMAGALAAVGIASMVARRLLIGDSASDLIGRIVTIAAALVVVATGGFLMIGAAFRIFG